MECPTCHGAPPDGGCKDCINGQFMVEGCPTDFITPDVWELLRYSNLYDKGIAPISGGAMDQTRSFTDGCAFVWAEQSRWKAEAR